MCPITGSMADRSRRLVFRLAGPGYRIGAGHIRVVYALPEKTFKGNERSNRKIAGLEKPWKNFERIGS